MKKQERIILIQKWLNSRGGRTFSDVNKDSKGHFVFMGDGSFGETKVYIPSDERMKKDLLTKKYYPKKNVSK